MQCPRCQQECPTSPNFCAECGTPLSPPTTSGSPGASYADLERALSEALEQQAVTGEILRVISSSRTALQPVLDAVAENASRLCRAANVSLYQAEGDLMRKVAEHEAGLQLTTLGIGETRPITRTSVSGRAIIDNVAPELAGFVRAHPIAPGRQTVTARAALGRRTIHVIDLQADPEYRYALRDDAAPIRTELGVPMFRVEDIPGVIVLYKLEVAPFTDQQVALVETFADQAVIAIENVRLFRELEARNRELTDALDRQTATAEILRAISQAQADVQPVFEVIADSSMRLLGAWAASVWAFRQEDYLIRLAAARGGLPGSIEPFMEQRGVPHRPVDGSLSGRTVLTRTVQHIIDANTDPS